MAIHTQRTNDDETIHVDDTIVARDSSTNWWPLLLIPLVLLIALAGVSAYQNGFATRNGTTPNQPPVIHNNENVTNPNDAQLGIGGAPEVVSPTPTPGVIPTDTTIPPISIAPPEPDTEY